MEPLAKGITLPTLCVILAGCATMSDDLSQAVSFRIEPAVATCAVIRSTIDPTRPAEELGTLSGGGGTIQIGRTSRDIVVRCQAPGYLTETAVVKPVASQAARNGWKDALANTIDDWSGASFSYPADVEIKMTPR